MKRLFLSGFALVALLAVTALSMPAPSLAAATEPVFTTATHAEKIVPIVHVIATVASHDLATPMSGSTSSMTAVVETASLPGVQMKPGRLARILPIPWRG